MHQKWESKPSFQSSCEKKQELKVLTNEAHHIDSSVFVDREDSVCDDRLAGGLSERFHLINGTK